jgi:hypothetical protein
MTNDYTTSTDAFADIPEAGYSSSDYPSMATFVTSASRLVDREIGRWDGFFYPTSDSVDWYYDGSGEGEQEIDEFVSISAVAVSEEGSVSSTDYTSWTLNTDYITKPYNASGKGRPINHLEVVRFNGTKPVWYGYQKSVKVTGIPGYSSTPPDIVKQACKMQAVRWFMRAKQGYQDTGANLNIGGLSFSKSLELDPDIRQLLWSIKLELDR